ncbi:MAG TPA: tetratricopeptide repeat protein [bacterium]|nr:tetratricopeptide repeat protein [bacterium]
MQKRISNALLDQLSEFVSVQMGLHFQKGRRLDLLRGVRTAAKEFGFEDIEECIHWLLSRPLKKNQIEVLASHLTVGETYFFREPKVFEVLEKQIFPALIRERYHNERRIRIWSAGSCTGEEAYSIAILLERLIPEIDTWNIKILATDINPIFLKRASEGLYREWSFRGSPYWLKEQYFKTTPEGFYEIIPRIRRKVLFQYLNLVEDVFPSLYNETNAMDLIFCRNVLMYFSPKQVRNCVERFHHCLLDDARLVVASSETSPIFSDFFLNENYPGAILYRKRSEKVTVNPLFSAFSYLQFDEEEKDTEIRKALPATVEEALFSPESPPSVPVTNKFAGEAEEAATDWIEEATTFYEQGRYAEALNRLTDKLKDDPKNVAAIILSAKIMANQGRLEEALLFCEQALKIDKLDAENHHLHAVILFEMGKTEDATTALKRVLYLESDFIMAYFMMGNIALQNGKNGESVKYFDNALQLLSQYRPEDILPRSDGMTAGHLREMIHIVTKREATA